MATFYRAGILKFDLELNKLPSNIYLYISEKEGEGKRERGRGKERVTFVLD